MITQIPVAFTHAAGQFLSLEVLRKTGITISEGQIVDYFNAIHYWQPDGSAHIELGRHETLDRNPHVITFEADDFKYVAD